MKKLFILLISVSFVSTNVQAESYEDYEGIDYEAILSELSTSQTTAPQAASPFEDVMIHVGIGFVNSVFTLENPNGKSVYVSPKGFQLALGIDLFSKNWIAEGILRNYGESHYETANLSAHEFDLRVHYRKPLNQLFSLNIGTGIGARYLSVTWIDGDLQNRQKYQSPTSIFFTGIDTYISNEFSVGAEIAARTPLTDETPDDTSIELGIRLDGHF